MAMIITGTHGVVTLWNSAERGAMQDALRQSGSGSKPAGCSFARLSQFAANSNHAPSGTDDDICWDQGKALLLRIAGVFSL